MISLVLRQLSSPVAVLDEKSDCLMHRFALIVSDVKGSELRRDLGLDRRRPLAICQGSQVSC